MSCCAGARGGGEEGAELRVGGWRGGELRGDGWLGGGLRVDGSVGTARLPPLMWQLVTAGWLQQDHHCAEQLKPGSVDSQCEDRLVSTRQVQRQKERPGVEPYHGRPRSCRGAVARGPAIEGEA